MMSIDSEIEKVAKAVCEGAAAEGVTLVEKVEALKVLTSFLGVLYKHKKLDETDDQESFLDFQNEVVQHNGQTAVRNRRGA